MQQRRQLPSQDTQDPDFRRLKYCRYADDFILGFIGPKSEAEEIKAAISTFLREELHLEMSESKTLITHARTEHAHFLGYAISVYHRDDKLSPQNAVSQQRHPTGHSARIGRQGSKALPTKRQTYPRGSTALLLRRTDH